MNLLISHYRDRGTNGSMNNIGFLMHCSMIISVSLSGQLVFLTTLVHLDGTITLFLSIFFKYKNINQLTKLWHTINDSADTVYTFYK